MRCPGWIGTRAWAEGLGPSSAAARAAAAHRWPLLLGALLALGAAALTPTPALAVIKTWTGLGGDANWFTGGNWSGNTRPNPGDDLVFPAGASQPTNTNDFPAGTFFNSIVIAASGYTFNGTTVTIADGQTLHANYSGTSTINLPVSGNTTAFNVVQMGSTLVFGGSVNDRGSPNKHGLGTAVLLAPGTTSGGWRVRSAAGGGILNVQNGGALGGGVSVSSGATLQVQGGITVPDGIQVNGGTGAPNATGAVESVSGANTLTGGIRVFGDTTVSADAGSTLTVSTTPVQLLTFTLTANIAGAATIASPIQDTGGLTKTGTGVLTLSGVNTYTGPTTVNAGTLLVNGSQPSSPVTVNPGGTLGGTGTTGPLTANGTVSPGVSGPGILRSGNATFNGGSTFAVDLNGTTAGNGYDQLFTAGTVTLLGPTLAVSVGFPSAPGNVFAIIQSNGAISGGFSGLPEGTPFTSGGRTFRINYPPNAVTLTDVSPTPTPTGTPPAMGTPTPTPTPCILGDINCDGIVDIRDYGIWRQNFGQTNCGNPADLNGDCIVDIRDYGIWRANFGHTAGAALVRTATPTPTPTPRSSSAQPERAAEAWPYGGARRVR